MINTQEFEQAVAGDWLGVVQPDACKWGGISALLPIAKKINASGKRYCPHYLGGGVGLAARDAYFIGPTYSPLYDPQLLPGSPHRLAIQRLLFRGA